jgi:S-DNA-T family DNA segregation ATPase FtsK/SpoIIIE
MARKRKSPRGNSGNGKKSRQHTSLVGRLFRFLFSSPIWQLALLIIVVALAVIFREALGNFWDSLVTFRDGAVNAWRSLVETFGLGLIFFLAAIVTLFVLFRRRRMLSLLFRWHRWLGAIILVLVAWGILATIPYDGDTFNGGVGGNFGKAIIGYSGSGFIYGLRLFGITVIAIIFIIPRKSYRAAMLAFAWLSTQLSRPARKKAKPKARPPVTGEVSSRPFTGEKTAFPSLTGESPVPREVVSARQKLEDLAKKAAALKPGAKKPVDESPESVRGDLRQVADDVWKRYGKSAQLVEVEGWKLPPVDILDTMPEVSFSEADNLQRARLIEEALASYGVDSKVVQINAGPTVTQFGVEPGWDRKFKEVKEKDRDGNVQVRTEEVSKTRVKVERISSLANDLALALAAPSIRIEAPVPGKSIVGVEVPNMTSDMVSLRGVVETAAFQKTLSKTKMALALGKGAGGESIAADLTKMPHLLIAGATGSGKTVCLNTIICCLLMHNTPNDVRFILIDPKRVELTQYNSIPHLAAPVIVETPRALDALRWLSQEMDKRYQKLAAAGARHIEGYNKGKSGTDKLPFLVLVIDELADLMMAGFDEVEANLCRLAQLARATGIHLVVATQRPSVDVVTGLIKANFPTRISFAVTSQVDSRTILDGAGAEKLLGRGDMLYMPTEAAKPKRLQGCFLSDTEIDRLVYFWASQQREEPDKLRMETLIASTPAGTIGGYPRDPLLDQARELARTSQNISTSFLQRRLHIGYPRAARLMEQLEAVLQQEQAQNGEHINEETMESDVEEEDINRPV